MRTILVALIAGFVGSLFASLIVAAWTGPTGSAPSNNVAAPLNVGTADQVKNGGLSVNALAVFGNAIFDGSARTYLNFGSTAGSGGYGIRDNSGTLEFKNMGGSWQGMASPSDGMGAGQTWQDVSASRTFGTTYTNSTGKPISVSVWNTVSNTSMSLFVDGIEVGRLQDAVQWGWDVGQLTAIVPNGSTYSVTGTRHSTVFKWTELR